jgi:hypothetical protein
MPLTKPRFQPGVNKESTEYADESGWFDSDKIRFRQGKPEKIGGWQKYSTEVFLGTCRSIFDWATNAFSIFLSIGTHLKFYVSSGTTYNDITPIRKVVNPMATNPFTSGSAGSTLVTVTDVTHGCVVNDFVTFSGASSFDGIPDTDLNKEHQVVAVINADIYQINVATPCTAGAVSGGGSAVIASYQINVGLDDYVVSGGWGSGPWSLGPWGSATPLTASNQLRLWSQENYGNDLIFNVRGGGIYYWDESLGITTRAVALQDVPNASDAPTLAIQIMVSENNGQVIAFGCNPLGGTEIDPLLVRWSRTDSPIDWTPKSTNDAGGQFISSGSFIITAKKTKQEILIFTDASIYSMRYVGAPFVYSFSLISNYHSCISPNSVADANGLIFFMDEGNFYTYNGVVQTLDCTVLDYVFSDINLSQAYKIFAGTNSPFSEVTWYYPSANSSEVDRYVTYNYKENLWYIGTMQRAYYYESALKNFPLASGCGLCNGYLFRHEVGHDADGQPLYAFIESGSLELDPGQKFMFMSRIIPDFEFKGSLDPNMLNVVIKGKDYPLQQLNVKSNSVIGSSTEQVFVRNRMREAAVRIESNGLGYGWRMGDLRFDLKADGQR